MSLGLQFTTIRTNNRKLIFDLNINELYLRAHYQTNIISKENTGVKNEKDSKISR